MREESSGIIIGISIGVVIGVALAVGAFFCIRYHRKRSQIGNSSSRRAATIPIRTNGADSCTILSDSSFGTESPKSTIQNGMPFWLRGLKKANVVSASGILEYSYKDLQKATYNFTTLIGQGAYGPVYKAQMSTGQTVAVKMLATDSKQGEKEFQTEVMLLGRLHHRNLVNLVGYCAEKNQHMLIYVYMSRGSLASHLYNEKLEPLNWELRVQIALDVARGLEYLHDGAVPPVIHRDIKSSNILLDQSRSSPSQKSAVETIHQWRSRASHELIFDAGRREISQYMEAVDRLHQTPNEKVLDELMSVALARLMGEFVAVLRRQAENQAGPISNTEWSSVTDSTAYAFRYEDYVISEPPSDYVITYLRDIARRMDSCGKIGECIEEYKSLRKNFLQSQLKRLRFEELIIGYNARRNVWDELKVKMELWIQVSKICVKILFEREKQLCERIFDNVAKDECFIGTVQDFAAGLFGFAEDMSLSNQPYQRMEAVLVLYNAFVWVLPHANALFDCELGKGIRNTCTQTLSRMENDVRRMLYDFENTVLNEVSDIYDDGGVVHQSTCYVMEQVEIIVRNKNLLTNLIKSTPLLRFGDLNIPQEALGDLDNHSFLELHLILILVVLQRNLETKSRSYENPSLGQLFMMNNIHYILQKIEGSKELQEMIGDSYMRKLNENFKVAKDGYETSTCNKFLTCFKDEGLYITRCFKSQPSKTVVRKRIKNFNAAFEEIRLLHSFWKIPNSELRDDVTASLSEKLVPAYKHFLEKFEDYHEIKLIMKKNVKYSAKDLEDLVLEKLFV